MKKLARYGLPTAGVLTALTLAALFAWPREPVDFEAALTVGRRPQIRPDYHDVVIPPNIAPLGFIVEEAGTDYRVRVRSAEDALLEVASRTAAIGFSQAAWRRLLSEQQSNGLWLDVCVRREDGRWTRFDPIAMRIAEAPVDRYLFYRLIKPIHILRRHINIFQRDLESYDESLALSNRSFEGGCINCHAFAPNHPDRMIVHSRGSEQTGAWSGMTVVRDGRITRVDTRQLVRDPESDRGRITKEMAAYTAWHPHGRLLAFSANKISQFFHAVGEVRDVFDSESDLAICDLDTNTVTTTPSISRPDRLETFPAWSPDGRYLYFCSAEPLPVDRYREIRYDLMRIEFDADTGRWGELEEVLRARETGLSITEPRISPDGRWVLFCMSDYGAFPVFQSSSDLYLLDLNTRDYRRLDINSEQAESWHCWSSNSRWIAFVSKRRDGMFARIYFSHVDEAGRAHKPFVLPQEDPSFYDRFIETYTVPELSRTPAPAGPRALSRAIRQPPPDDDARQDRDTSMESMGIQ